MMNTFLFFFYSFIYSIMDTKQLDPGLIEYLSSFEFVNMHEVVSAVNDYMLEELGVLEPSFEDLMNASTAAQMYVEQEGIKFEPDLVCTIDIKNKELHLQDLNWELTDEQVAEKEKQRNVAFKNACDCLYYWYGKKDWNCNWLDEWEQVRVWNTALDVMSNDF